MRVAANKEEVLRITDQFRGKNGMVYDLKIGPSRLTLCISPRMTSQDAGDWHIEAAVSKAPDGVVVGAWGPTKAGALAAVGKAWAVEATAGTLPVFDWDAVRKALDGVRAL